MGRIVANKNRVIIAYRGYYKCKAGKKGKANPVTGREGP
jgi:hypothetical protein